jgi:predicted secreted hydrolase
MNPCYPPASWPAAQLPTARPSVRTAALMLAVILTGCAAPGTIAGSGRLPSAPPHVSPTPPPPILFPADEAPHHDLTEWWYYTGHLQGTDGQGGPHAYGFELTFFQTLRGQFPPYYAAHFGVSDLTRGQFHFDQRAVFGSPSAIPPAGSRSGFNLSVGGWQMRGLNGQDHLAATMDGYAIDLSLRGVKPAVLHGGTGLITLGLAGFSYYYSRPRMAVAGTVSDHGATVPVSGIAWMDHQWGNFVSLAGAGWDWFSIQLDDNTEYMLYVIRDAQKRPLSTVGTYVAPNGAASEVPASAISAQATGTWISPVTGGIYPSGWRVTVSTQGLVVTLAPDLLDQELVTASSAGVAYWEGAVRATGTLAGQPVTGQGYVELTGYASIPSGTQGPAIP